MKLTELVNVDAIRLRLQAKTKREAIAERFRKVMTALSQN